MEPEQLQQTVKAAVQEALGQGMDSKRYIDVSRIPLICQNIDGIHNLLKDLSGNLETKYVTKEAFEPVKNLIYGATGLILVAVVGALMTLVLIHK